MNCVNTTEADLAKYKEHCENGTVEYSADYLHIRENGTISISPPHEQMLIAWSLWPIIASPDYAQAPVIMPVGTALALFSQIIMTYCLLTTVQPPRHLRSAAAMLRSIRCSSSCFAWAARLPLQLLFRKSCGAC